MSSYDYGGLYVASSGFADNSDYVLPIWKNGAINTSAYINQTIAPFNGYLTKGSFNLLIGLPTSYASNENVELSIVINGNRTTFSTTDLQFDKATTTATFDNLFIPINQGDLYYVEMNTPTWVTNPSNATMRYSFIFEEATTTTDEIDTTNLITKTDMETTNIGLGFIILAMFLFGIIFYFRRPDEK